MAKVICVGSSVADTIFGVSVLPSGGGKNRAHTVLETIGGLSANASVTISRLGGDSVLWSRVGDDAAGDRIIQDIEGCGVDVANVQRVKGLPSPISTVAIDDRGERQVLNCLNPYLFDPPHGLPLEEISSAQALLADVRWPDGGTAALQEASKMGIPRVLDYEKVPDEREALMANLASHVLFSQEGLQTFSETSDIGEGLARASKRTDAWLGVTCGAAGVYWLCDGIVKNYPAFEVDVVDTLAAGDVFHGAFALALAESRMIEDALRFASAASALKCTRFGGRLGIPNRDEVEDMMNGELQLSQSQSA